MVLAIPYYLLADPENPIFVAYNPLSIIKQNTKGYRCQPAKYENETPVQRPSFKRFFDGSGLKLVESPNWSEITINDG